MREKRSNSVPVDLFDRLRSADSDERLRALRELRIRGPAAGQWVSGIIRRLSGLKTKSLEWGET